MLSLASTSTAPYEWKIAPAVSTLSAVVPRPMPKGKPALWQASAALRKASSVQASAFAGLPAGYIACTSMPAYCFIKSMREQGPLIWLPTVAGTATQLPLILPRYSTVALTLPFCSMSLVMTSSTGSRLRACSAGNHVDMAMTSCPLFRSASAAIVSNNLLPCEGMKSICTSTFSLPAHSSTKACVVLLAPGTQWSQKATASLPAAPAVRTKGAATMLAAAAAVVAMNLRRDILLRLATLLPPLLHTGLVGPVCRLADSRLNLCAHEALDLALRPGQRLFPRLALHVAHVYLGHQTLGIDLHGDLVRGRCGRNRKDLMIVRIGVVIERALRRTLLTPGLEGRQIGKCRDVVTLAGFHHLLRGFRR